MFNFLKKRVQGSGADARPGFCASLRNEAEGSG
jgi:hypothetical protein